jgi:hypothetical protein
MLTASGASEGLAWIILLVPCQTAKVLRYERISLKLAGKHQCAEQHWEESLEEAQSFLLIKIAGYPQILAGDQGRDIRRSMQSVRQGAFAVLRCPCR